jgi:hypothetical protein
MKNPGCLRNPGLTSSRGTEMVSVSKRRSELTSSPRHMQEQDFDLRTTPLDISGSFGNVPMNASEMMDRAIAQSQLRQAVSQVAAEISARSSRCSATPTVNSMTTSRATPQS